MTFEEKFAKYKAEIKSDSELSVKLSSESATATHNIIGSIVSKIAQDFDDYFATSINSAGNTLASRRVMNKYWYIQQSLLFQFGDELLLDSNFDLYYQNIDTAKQIVKFVLPSEGVGQVFLKVGKEVGGVPSPLTTEELNAFIAYWDQKTYMPNFLRKPQGDSNITSQSGDKVTLSFKAWLDPTKYVVGSQSAAENGKNLITGEKDVENAILKSLINKEKFGGEVKLSQIEAEVYSYSGVSNFVITSSSATDYNNQNPIDIAAALSRSYLPYAGYVANLSFGTKEYLKEA